MMDISESKPTASLSSSLLARKGDAKPAMRRQGLTGLTTAPKKDNGEGLEDLGWNDMGYDVDPQPEDDVAVPTSMANGKAVNPLAAAVPEVVKQRDDLEERLKADDSLGLQDTHEIEGRDAEEAEVSEELSSEAESADPIAENPENAVSGAPVEMANSPLSVKKPAPNAEQEKTEKVADLGTMPSPQMVEVKAVRTPVIQASKPKKPAIKSGKRAAFTLRVDPERHLRLRLACALSNISAQQLVTQALDEFLEKMPEIDELAGKAASGGRT
ncbi:hypothetical protein [Sphingorhabdus sp. Alg239-R122]|uniref:hypothetical protein n=1 Tax=Sphingorhabdus sp. Alg239-R122 TaxID=2305989 RepID=UPI0013DD467C|nr:hypothetical protein [Sphingorhabdus sp. Alg239-R122]